MTSDPGEVNAIFTELDLDAGGLTVSDELGMIATPPCILLAPYKAFCGVDTSSFPNIAINTGDGNDLNLAGPNLLVIPLLLGQSSLFKVNGGAGDDVITGTFGPDQLIGGPGKDRLVGLYGSDTMSGGDGGDIIDAGSRALDGTNGRDRLLGGRGADTVQARDSTRDIRIDCGPGEDRLSRDRFDPKPSRCP